MTHEYYFESCPLLSISVFIWQKHFHNAMRNSRVNIIVAWLYLSKYKIGWNILFALGTRSECASSRSDMVAGNLLECISARSCCAYCGISSFFNWSSVSCLRCSCRYIPLYSLSSCAVTPHKYSWVSRCTFSYVWEKFLSSSSLQGFSWNDWEIYDCLLPREFLTCELCEAGINARDIENDRRRGECLI